MRKLLEAKSLEIRASDYARQRGEIVAIRNAVFVLEQGVPESLEHDEHDAGAWHVVAFCDGQAVGTGRLIHGEVIGRMAVLRGYRDRGVGRAMLDELLRAARESGSGRARLSAQVRAIPFYEKAGFVAEGPVFEEAGIAHRRMTRPL